jgi:hypothetical protein
MDFKKVVLLAIDADIRSCRGGNYASSLHERQDGGYSLSSIEAIARFQINKSSFKENYTYSVSSPPFNLVFKVSFSIKEKTTN